MSEKARTVYLDLRDKTCSNPHCDNPFNFLVFQQEDFIDAFSAGKKELQTEFHFVCTKCYLLIKKGVY